MLKAAGTDMRAEYRKVIESFFWAYKANKQTICNEAVPEDVPEATPAGCGWTWSCACHLSHQPSQNTNS